MREPLASPGNGLARFWPWIHRLRADFRLAIVTLFSICSTLIILPFGIHRFLIGDFLIGVIDVAIVSVFSSVTVFAWRTGNSQVAGNLTAVLALLAALAAVILLGLSHMWVFSTLVAIYLLAQRWIALLASLVLIVATSLQVEIFATPLENWTFLAVATMVSLFAWIFASRVDSQRGQLTEIADRDPLTGAFNRRVLDRDLEMLVHDNRNDSRSVTIAIMDLDRFKPVNDEHGHDAGDRILVKMTEIVGSSTRQGDRFYRYGGEEFVLLLPDTDQPGALVALDNVIEAVRRQLASPGGPVTVSIGAARRMPEEGKNEWFGRADKALLRAKREGRDRIVFAE